MTLFKSMNSESLSRTRRKDDDQWVSNLKTAFFEVDKSNQGLITKEQFINSRLNSLIYDDIMTFREMEILFDQINTSIDSRISWNQFIDYLMTQNQNSKSFKIGKEISFEFVAPPLMYSSKFFRCPKIIRALYIASLDLLVSLTDKFMSVWNPKTCEQIYEFPNDSNGFFTDMCYIQSNQRIAIALDTRNIIFFDPRSMQKVKETISATIDSKK